MRRSSSSSSPCSGATPPWPSPTAHVTRGHLMVVVAQPSRARFTPQPPRAADLAPLPRPQRRALAGAAVPRARPGRCAARSPAAAPRAPAADTAPCRAPCLAERPPPTPQLFRHRRRAPDW
eukprot:XP_020399921.1 predicted GPI-anchored protein 58 [Zea mays]